MGMRNRSDLRIISAYIGGKCMATTFALARIMSNLGGQKHYKRRFLMKVVTSIDIYQGLIWAEAKDERTYRTKIKAALG